MLADIGQPVVLVPNKVDLAHAERHIGQRIAFYTEQHGYAAVESEADADILKVMLQDHVDGRAHVRAVAEALDARDLATAGARLQAYGELLTGHIQREDTILYPWINRRLTDRQVGELFAACMKVDQAFGEAPRRMEALVAKLEAAHA